MAGADLFIYLRSQSFQIQLHPGQNFSGDLLSQTNLTQQQEYSPDGITLSARGIHSSERQRLLRFQRESLSFHGKLASAHHVATNEPLHQDHKRGDTGAL